MKTTVLLALAFLFLGPSTSWAQSQTSSDAKWFHFSSRGTAFGVQGDFFGTYIIEDDSIAVNVTKATIYVSEHCPYKGRRGINQLTIGLATEIDPNGRWKIESVAQPTLLEIVMSPKDERTFYGLYFRIPKKRDADLTKRWLVVEIQDQVLDPPPERPAFSKGSAFTHSCKDIFSQSDRQSKSEASFKPSGAPRACH
jgi:hypothetical protein